MACSEVRNPGGLFFWKLVGHLAGADSSVRPLCCLLDEHIVLSLVLQAQLFLRDRDTACFRRQRVVVGGTGGARVDNINHFA